MPEYRIQWEIEIDADSPEEAAREALKIHSDPESIATVFKVIGENDEKHIVDLSCNVEYCAICERNVVNENSNVLKGVGRICDYCSINGDDTYEI